ncbi:GNAT family N-acetyltransferase [Sphingopyxis fribergensis]
MTDTLLALSTDHCRITPLFADDARALSAITDETVTSQVHFLPAPFTEADARALIAGSGGGDVFHAVRDESGLDLNGVIGVHRRLGQEYEIGYWFAARARGKGIATEAVRAVVGALASSGRAARSSPNATRRTSGRARCCAGLASCRRGAQGNARAGC